MILNKDMEKLWDKVHRDNNTYMQTDSSLQHILCDLELIIKFVNSETILEIGVGTARCSNEIINLGKMLYCVDISELALSKVRPSAATYLNTEMDILPNDFFDLAISMCVSQHIDNDELERHLTYTIKSLKEDGIFALQLNINKDDSQNNIKRNTPQELIAGMNCRDTKFMEKMANNCGGEVIR